MNQITDKKTVLSAAAAAAVLIAGWNQILVRSGLKFSAGMLIADGILSAAFLFAFFCILRGERKTGQDRIICLAGLLLLLILSVSFLAEFNSPETMWDSWQIYDMSRYVMTDFGYGQMIRQHIVHTHYEMAFPPLMLWMVYLFNEILDLKVMAEPVLTFLFSLLTVGELWKILFRMKRNRLAAAAAVLLVLTGNEYLVNLMTGNTIIIGFYFMVRLSGIASGDWPLMKKYRWSVITASLALMLRFDMLSVFCICLVLYPLLIVLTNRKERRKVLLQSVLVTGTAFLIISPWILYSVGHFDSFFITDNFRRVINIPDTWPFTYFPPDMPALTAADDFGMWLKAIPVRILSAFRALIHVTVFWSMLPWIVISIIPLLRIRQIKERLAGWRENRSSISCEKLIFAAALCSQEALVLITGFPNPRYHLSFVLLFSFLLLEAFDFEWNVKKYPWILKGGLLLYSLQIAGNLFSFVPGIRADFRDGTGYAEFVCLNEIEDETDRCLSKRDAVLMLDPNTYKLLSHARYSALCHHATTMIPGNLSEENLVPFIREFEIDHIYTDRKEVLKLFSEDFILEDAGVPDVYRIEFRQEF